MRVFRLSRQHKVGVAYRGTALVTLVVHDSYHVRYTGHF